MNAKYRSSQSLNSIIEFVIYLDELRDKNSGPDGKWRCKVPQSPKGGWVVDKGHLAKVFGASSGWIGHCLKGATLVKDERVRRLHPVISRAYHEVMDDEEQDTEPVEQGAGTRAKWGALSLMSELARVAVEAGIEIAKEGDGNSSDGENA